MIENILNIGLYNVWSFIGTVVILACLGDLLRIFMKGVAMSIAALRGTNLYVDSQVQIHQKESQATDNIEIQL